MNIVLDANLIASLAIPLPYSEAATAQLLAWKRQGVALFAPSLWSYEVSTVLRKAVVMGYLPASQLDAVLAQIWGINIQEISANLELYQKTLTWAERLGHSKTYDSAYLATAESLQAAFWTADRRLARAALQAGITWVYLIIKS